MLLALYLIKSQRTYYSLILAFVTLFSVFCVYRIQFLRFDYDFEAFFPNENNELEVYNNFRNTFEHDNEFALIAVENNAGIFKKSFLLRVDSLTKAFSEIKNIQKVTSPTNLKNLSFGSLLPLQSRVLHFENDSLYKEDSIRIYESPHLVGSFFPLNAKSVTIYLKTEEGLNKKESDSLAKNIETALGKFKFDEIHYVGRIFAQNVYLENLKSEFGIFLGLSFLVVIIFLWFSFKSIYGIIVPISIVLISILWTLGIMSVMGKAIDIMTVMLPTMIFIAGMSDVVHFFSKYFEELAKGTEKEKIYKLILKEVGFPTLLTLITTVVGFLSLLFSSIIPIKEFGIYTSVGVVIAFLLSYSLLPALLHFFTPKKLVTVHGHNNRTYNVMRNGLFWIFRHQRTILVITAVVLVFSVIGIYKVRVNNILLEDLSEHVKIKRDFNFFDQNYSGVRPLEIKVTLNDKRKSLWDYEAMKELDKVDRFITREYNPGFLISPASLAIGVYRSSNEISNQSFPVKEDLAEVLKQLKENRNNKEIKRIITPDGSVARISAKIRDIGSIKVSEHNAHLENYIKSNIDTTLMRFQVTGAAHLVDRNNSYMVSNMTQGFIFSLVVIAILTFFLHRSWRMV
ncbi:MAG: efflux RND transporter permease subunit, partial [Bacteroidia bacterium]